MKSMLFSALAIFALATTGCALQTGGGGCSDGLCGNQSSAGCNDCSVLSGDCNCGAPRGLTPSCNLVRKLGDNRGMGMRVNQKGSACNQGRNNGLFSRMSRNSSVAPAASMGCDSCGMADNCGCGGNTLVSMSDGGCGCESGASDACGSGGCSSGGCSSGTCSSGGCSSGTCGSGGGLLGKLGSGGCGGCKLGKCLFGCKGGAVGGGLGLGGGQGLGGGRLGGCGMNGCGIGGKLCGGCLSKLAGAHNHPYGGTIPHTAQAPGAGTGMAPAYAYPYYTTRSPRDFLTKKPPTIGY